HAVRRGVERPVADARRRRAAHDGRRRGVLRRQRAGRDGGAGVIQLRGMTWNHPRGVDPLVAHARHAAARFGVDVAWDARSLEDFEAHPLDDLAARYDLMVIDHPHTGMAAASGCLLPLDGQGRDAELRALEGNTVGSSHESYNYAGRQWALAIDA